MRKVAIVLSGGAGTRLWPLSTERRPKQFLPLFGAETLYQKTLKRLAATGIEHVYVVGNAEHGPLLAEQAKEAFFGRIDLVYEPMRRGSAPAIAAGLIRAEIDHGDDVTALVLPCDHLIPDESAFAASVSEAFALADLGNLGTFGIRPTFPSTEFGYIQRGAPIPGHPNAFHVDRFHEKPKRAVAESYLLDGGFFWNSGMFAFPVRLFAAEAERHMPAVWAAASAAVADAVVDRRGVYLDASSFAKSPDISVDFGLMERSERIGMVPASFAWSDVGTWGSVHEGMPRDTSGTATVGEVTHRDMRDSLIVAEGVRVIAAGLDDVVIVATRDGVFVSRKDNAAIVKTLLGG